MVRAGMSLAELGELPAVIDLVTAAFGNRLTGDARPAPLREGDDAAAFRPARRTGLLHRKTEQTHLLLGSTGIARLDPRRYSTTGR